MDTNRQYEVVFIVDPTADDDEVARLTESFKQIITDQGGKITKEESMGRRQLAYEILHKTEGSFMLLEIEGSGREIAELERRMRVNDRVLRYITVRVDEDRRRAEKLKARRARKAGGPRKAQDPQAAPVAEAGEPITNEDVQEAAAAAEAPADAPAETPAENTEEASK